MDIVKKYNNTYHNTIKIIPVHVISNEYINSSKEINDKNPKLKIGYIARISNYKNICPKSYVSNWCEEIFVIKKVKNTKFTKKICQKQIKKSLELKKQFKKGNKLCVRWKGYNNSFNSCIDKKDIK